MAKGSKPAIPFAAEGCSRSANREVSFRAVRDAAHDPVVLVAELHERLEVEDPLVPRPASDEIGDGNLDVVKSEDLTDGRLAIVRHGRMMVDREGGRADRAEGFGGGVGRVGVHPTPAASLPTGDGCR